MRRSTRLFWRALHLHCPHCGGGNLFRSWFRMRAHCPACGLPLEREAGAQVGSYMFSIIVAELVFALVLAILLVITWPYPPWTIIQAGMIVLMVVLPVLFYPFSKTLFLALDLWVRPPSRDELS